MSGLLAQYVSVLPGVLAPVLLFMSLGATLSITEKKTRPKSDRLRLIGVVIGVIAAVVFATLRALAIVQQRTAVNIPTLIACVIVDVLLIAVVCLSPRIKQNPLWYVISNFVALLALALAFFRALPNVILQLTDFILPDEPIFTSDMLMRALGFCLGFVTAIVAAWVFRTSKPLASPQFFHVATICLTIIVLVQHVVSLLQVLQSTRHIFLSSGAFKVLVWFINHSTWLVILQAIIFLLPAASGIVKAARLRLDASIPALRRAQRKFRLRAYSSTFWSVALVGCIALSLTAGIAYVNQEPVLSPPEEYELTETTAIISISQVEDGHLHRFEYQAEDGTTMRFIVVKKGGEAYGVGLDACENCGDAGYYEKDGYIICKQCDVAINLATIGSAGGCNPIPLTFEITDNSIRIQTADLDALSSVFK